MGVGRSETWSFRDARNVDFSNPTCKCEIISAAIRTRTTRNLLLVSAHEKDSFLWQTQAVPVPCVLRLQLGEIRDHVFE